MTRRTALTAVSCGRSFQRAFEASSVGASWVTGKVAAEPLYDPAGERLRL